MAIQFMQQPGKPPEEPKEQPKAATKKFDDSNPPWEDHLPAATPTVVVSNVGQSTVAVEKYKKQEDGSTAPLSLKTEEKLHKGPKPLPKASLASVTVGGGMTLNLGNFEFAKISVFITLPCAVEDKDATYETASNWVSERIEKAVMDAKGGTAAPVAVPTTEHI